MGMDEKSTGLRERARALVDSKRFQGAIIVVIIVNAVMIGAQTYPALGGNPVMIAADRVVLGIFVVEIALRIWAHGGRFFRDGWSWFDLFVVTVSLLPTAGPFQVLRVLRVLRVMRLISAIPSLRKVVGALIAAVPGIASIGALLVIVMYVFVVATTVLFGQVSEDFRTLGDSTISLFRLLVGDGWALVDPVAEELPYAWPFMMVYAVVSTFVILNLFIAVTTEAMYSQRDEVTTPTVTEQRILDDIAALRADLAARPDHPGVRGPAGPDGVPGSAGTDGAPEATGPAGTMSPGTAPEAPGTAGPTGAAAAEGAPESEGAAGTAPTKGAAETPGSTQQA